MLKIRIDKHLSPYFGGRRMAAITTSDVTAYVARRQGEGAANAGAASKALARTTRLVAVSTLRLTRVRGAVVRFIIHPLIAHGRPPVSSRLVPVSPPGLVDRRAGGIYDQSLCDHRLMLWIKVLRRRARDA